MKRWVAAGQGVKGWVAAEQGEEESIDVPKRPS